MRVLLIDVDSKIPNLALMKISAYHKARGDAVGFDIKDPGKIYASIIFNKNKHKADGLKFMYPNAEIDIGGSGYNIDKKLPDEINACVPDYSLYPESDTYLGFTTRGCIRNCYFCIVRRKEGEFRRLFATPKAAIESIIGNADPKDVRKLTFLDNNILADKAWFMELTEYILTTFPKAKIDFNQGLDVRLLDDEIAARLRQLRPITCWKFAYDSKQYTEAVLNGIALLKNAGINTRHDVEFYVYCHGNDQVNDAVERCELLKANGTSAYSMINRDVKQTVKLRALARWTRPWVFWSCDYNDFLKTYKGAKT